MGAYPSKPHIDPTAEELETILSDNNGLVKKIKDKLKGAAKSVIKMSNFMDIKDMWMSLKKNIEKLLDLINKRSQLKDPFMKKYGGIFVWGWIAHAYLELLEKLNGQPMDVELMRIGKFLSNAIAETDDWINKSRKEGKDNSSYGLDKHGFAKDYPIDRAQKEILERYTKLGKDLGYFFDGKYEFFHFPEEMRGFYGQLKLAICGVAITSGTFDISRVNLVLKTIHWEPDLENIKRLWGLADNTLVRLSKDWGEPLPKKWDIIRVRRQDNWHIGVDDGKVVVKAGKKSTARDGTGLSRKTIECRLTMDWNDKDFKTNPNKIVILHVHGGGFVCQTPDKQVFPDPPFNLFTTCAITCGPQ